MLSTNLLTTVAIASLVIAIAVALWIVYDEKRHPPKMRIMYFVWPLTALYGSVIALLAYRHFARDAHSHRPNRSTSSSFRSYALATTHCGAGCTLGDLTAECAMYFDPNVVTLFGYPALFTNKLFAGWIIDFVFAFAFGILFQYFAIKPMRHLSPAKGLLEAIKADSLSLIAWQVGMYGWMGIATFLIFRRSLSQADPVFWFMMQLAMICGFATSFPVNIWLIKKGIKEKM